MFKPRAEIIADSINELGDRLTTFVLTYHRLVHSEIMTHRQFSRNASSSRAIPVEKMIALVESQEVYPLHWGANQKGMVANQEVDENAQYLAKEIWKYAREDAIKHAKNLTKIGIHKQVVNRLLEPFSSITVICTATDYDNFFAQRCHESAQPEIRALADAMKAAYDASKPKLLTGKGTCMGWHIPFINEEDWKYLGHYEDSTIWDLVQIATGRCARVSYLNHDGKRSIEDDIKLHDRLLASQPPHLSPLEHCAIARHDGGKFANFTGWQSYRNMLETKGV